jgi:hypothetical protein
MSRRQLFKESTISRRFFEQVPFMTYVFSGGIIRPLVAWTEYPPCSATSALPFSFRVASALR